MIWAGAEIMDEYDEYELTQDVRLAAEVDDAEEMSGYAKTLPAGTVLTICRKKHEWGVHPNARKQEVYTVLAAGGLYNVVANHLERAVKRVRTNP
jgi:hypothetical protein